MVCQNQVRNSRNTIVIVFVYVIVVVIAINVVEDDVVSRNLLLKFSQNLNFSLNPFQIQEKNVATLFEMLTKSSGYTR